MEGLTPKISPGVGRQCRIGNQCQGARGKFVKKKKKSAQLEEQEGNSLEKFDDARTSEEGRKKAKKKLKRIKRGMISAGRNPLRVKGRSKEKGKPLTTFTSCPKGDSSREKK